MQKEINVDKIKTEFSKFPVMEQIKAFNEIKQYVTKNALDAAKTLEEQSNQLLEITNKINNQ